MQNVVPETKEVFVVLRNRTSREFRSLFSSLEAANEYIKCGKEVGIDGADDEFVERHNIRDS